MSRKYLAALILAAFVSAGVFAQQEEKKLNISAGIGGFLGGNFGGGFESSLTNLEPSSLRYGSGGKAVIRGQTGSIKVETAPQLGAGAYAFLDVKYVELTFAVYRGIGNCKTAIQDGVTDTARDNFDAGFYSIGLFGKYPFTINNRLQLFPLLGIDYQVCFFLKYDGENFEDLNGNGKADDIESLWLKFGGGLDYTFTEKIYLRLEALYGIMFANKFEMYARETIEEQFENKVVAKNIKILFDHGINVKLAIGYKF